MTFSSVSPESQGVPAAAVAAFLEGLKELALPMHSVLLVRRGALLAEYYAEPYPADVPHRIYSASKSFVALAVGLLVGEGKLSVRDRLAVYFPERCLWMRMLWCWRPRWKICCGWRPRSAMRAMTA